ncbi:MAG: phosphomethylpyrimidine synthase ThiC, partial [Desulfovibrio sp.]|nr:phosphomethylpyrimidine synthase ThiC [Desulfovibrio sp.]
MSATLCSQNAALRGLLDTHLATLAAQEGLTPETIVAALDAGTMVLLGNPAHAGLRPILVGQPARVKVNANIGTSPLNNCPQTE